jgi:competence ComEA-like helix-hairpin-helix protein
MRRKFIRRFWRRLPPLAFAAAALSVTACEPAAEEGEDVLATTLRPAWVQNQEFHLETRYNRVNLKTARGEESSDPSVGDALDETVELGSQWSENVYWRYQVIRQGFEPPEGDDFYEYAVKGGTFSPVTVIKASLDPALNLDSELAEADPKIYLVIREDRLRMAGMVYFYTLNGERIHDAVTVDDEEMNRSYSKLSQTNLSIIPSFVPPFPIVPENGDMELEDGQIVSFANADETSVDVVYENSMDDTLIAETWENGQPWALWSSTPNMESRLMSPDEVEDLAGPRAPRDERDEDSEDFDFVALLRQGINLSASLNVDQVLQGTQRVRDGFVPWAGYWWAQAEGNLIFGHLSSGNDTPSDLGRTAFAVHATSMQNLGEEMRTLRKNGQGNSPEYTEKTEAYKAAQSALVDAMVSFYNGIQNGISQNRIRIEGGHLVADADWHADYGAFNFDLNRMSPLDKFALLQQIEGHTHGTNPWFAPAWEMLNHWSPAGSGWWGHCNGWAAAAILTNEPRTVQTVNFGGDKTMELGVADQKGLLSESYYSQLSNFYGSRYNGDEGDDISDLSPKAVLQILSTYIGDRGVPLVFDVTAGDQVWNYPAYEYTLTLNETSTGISADGGGLININTAGVAELDTLWGINPNRANRIIADREARGPFQTPEDIIRVNGIGRGIYNRIKDQITTSVSTQLRTFDGTLTVRLADDGVGAAHVDSTEGQPVSIVRNWPFTLEASPAGEIINGTWDNNEDGHPDFAWIPYSNPLRAGRSENSYVEWADLKDYLPATTVRQ